MKELKVIIGEAHFVKIEIDRWLKSIHLVDFDITSNMNDDKYVICYIKYTVDEKVHF